MIIKKQHTKQKLAGTPQNTHTHTHTYTYIHTYTHIHIHTHTHTHIHTCFTILGGTSIGIMVFLLYRPYILSPYTNPTPKLSPHRRHFAFLDFQKTSFCVIYKLVYPWGPQVPMSLCVFRFKSPPVYKNKRTHAHKQTNRT